MSLLGAIAGLGGSLLQGVFEKKSADQQASAYGYNAEQMEKEKEFQKFRTDVILKRQGEYTNAILASQRAGYAKHGIQVDTGTALTMAMDTAARAAEDAALIRQEGEFNVARASAAGSMYSEQQSNMQRQGYIQAGTTILTGAWDFFKQL